MKLIKAQKDFLAGLLFLAVAAVFTVGLTELSVGSASQMGPGYFPMVLIILMGLFATILMVNGLGADGEPISGYSWRVPALIVLPIVLFGATLSKLGLVPALSAAIFTTTYAGRAQTLSASLVTTAVVVALCWGIFIWGLGLPIPSFGSWAGGY